MPGIRHIYHSAKRYAYLLRKLLASGGKVPVVYTKNHPIYTSLFEDGVVKGYIPVYINIKNGRLNFLENILYKKSKIIHADAANFPNKPTGKALVVECEGTPDNAYFQNKEVKKILVESKTAGRGFEANEKVALCYPAILPNKKEAVEGEYITLLSVGHGGYIKGYDVLYKLYKQLSKQYKIKLIIAGGFGHNYEYYPEVKQESYERENFPAIYDDLLKDENVTIKPFKREALLNEVYPAADIYIQFSRMETFGYAILEAMSFGLPVVSCHFKAIREMVQQGKNGYLVSSNGFDEQTNDYVTNINSTEWGENCFNEALGYVSSLIENKAQRIAFGNASLDIVKARFNLDDKKHFIENLYNDCLK